MKPYYAFLMLLSALPLIGCNATQPPAQQLVAGDFVVKVQVMQDGKVVKPDPSGVYSLRPAPFTIADTRSLPNIKHFFAANFNTDHSGSDRLMNLKQAGYRFGALIGTGAAWDEKVIHIDAEPLEIYRTDPQTVQRFAGLFSNEPGTTDAIIREATDNSQYQAVLLMFRRFPLHYKDTVPDTDPRNRQIQGFDEPGRFPTGDINLVLTLHRYGEPTQFVRDNDLTVLKLHFAKH